MQSRLRSSKCDYFPTCSPWEASGVCGVGMILLSTPLPQASSISRLCCHKPGLLTLPSNLLNDDEASGCGSIGLFFCAERKRVGLLCGGCRCRVHDQVPEFFLQSAHCGEGLWWGLWWIVFARPLVRKTGWILDPSSLSDQRSWGLSVICI